MILGRMDYRSLEIKNMARRKRDQGYRAFRSLGSPPALGLEAVGDRKEALKAYSRALIATSDPLVENDARAGLARVSEQHP